MNRTINKELIFNTLEYRDQLDYWLDILKEPVQPLELAADHSTRTISGEKKELEFGFPPQLAEKLIHFFKSNTDLTLHLLLLAAFQVFLTLYLDNEETILSLPLLKVDEEEDGKLTNEPFKTNTRIPFRFVLQPQQSFKELLVTLRPVLLAGYKNQDYPMELVLKHQPGGLQNLERFDRVIFSLRNNHDEAAAADLPYVLFFSFQRQDEQISAVIHYDSTWFEPDSVQYIADAYLHILGQCAFHMDQALDQLQLISEDRLQMILNASNPGSISYPSDATAAGLFASQAERTPDRIAMVGDSHLSYRHLDDRSSLLAGHLVQKGVMSGDIVGVLLTDPLNTVIAALAIMKAGGIYLPLDPDYPQQRITTMLNDSNARLLITCGDTIPAFSFTRLQQSTDTALTPSFAYTPPRPQAEDLDRLQIPDRSLIDYEQYSPFIGQAMVKNSITIHMSRGCVYQCAFCFKIWPDKYIIRSAENIFQEIKLYYDMGIRRFAFVDDLPNVNMKVSKKVFQLIIQHRLDIHLHFPNGIRGDILNKEYIDLMVKAGTITMDLALETTSPRLQKLIKKNLNLEKLEENIRYITETYPHVILELQLLHGIPSETEEEAAASLEFFKRIKWIHFPYIHILNIYPGSPMARIAEENGVSRQAIQSSADIAYHELPDTLPFSKAFTRKYQAEFLNSYFLNKARLLAVLPYQMNALTEDELVQKYNSYLPVEITNFDELLDYAGIKRHELTDAQFLPEGYGQVAGFNRKLQDYFHPQSIEPSQTPALKILLLDLSQWFKSSDAVMYDVVEPPLGLMYLLTHLNRCFGPKVQGKILKSRIDFASFNELRSEVEQFKPDVIGIRTLNFFKDFFHHTAALLRHWGIRAPIIAGGPYATSSTAALLQDPNIDLAVIGEGELTLQAVIGKMLDNQGQWPSYRELQYIQGLALPGARRGREILLMDHSNPFNGTEPNPELPTTSPDSGAYIIYTSGTTGRPKGVLIQHSQLVNQLTGLLHTLEPGDSFYYLLLASFTFDVSIMHMFLPLLNGARCVIPPVQIKKDGGKLVDFINRFHIDILNLVPAFMEALLENLKDKSLRLTHLLIGGERFPTALYHRLLPHIASDSIINIYGPTETTINATMYRCTGKEHGDTLPIGKPLPNYRVYILNRRLLPSPTGVPGELYISGPGLSLGYLNNPELTHQQFPMTTPGHRSYKTGDRARWLPGGTIEFLGRVDRQIKIRGFRIEVDEITAQLTLHPAVKQAVVKFIENSGKDAFLCGYIVPLGDVYSTHELYDELKDYLNRRLPGFMVPACFVSLDRFPLTSAGKIDMEALPLPLANSDDRSSEPGNATEAKLAAIWEDVLGVSPGIDDNFFHSGGHSLSASVLVSRVQQELQVDIPLMELFQSPSIRGLSSYIEKTGSTAYSEIPAAEDQEYYALSSAQKRLFILQQTNPASTAYNLPVYFHLQGELDLERMRRVFLTLIQRHASLRTSFFLLNGDPVQRIHRHPDWDIGPIGAIGPIKANTKPKAKPFDLSEAPLLRVEISSESSDNHLLMMDIHHIIADGISLGILAKEMMQLYRGEELAPLFLRYIDFSQWIDYRPMEAYWLEQFSEDPPTLDLPSDFPRPPVQDYKGRAISFSIETQQTAALKQLALDHDATLYMTLAALLTLLLSKLSRSEDIVIGTPSGGRRHADLQPLVGMFVNTLALRFRPKSDLSFLDYLQQVKKVTLGAFENQEYPFDDLAAGVTPNRDISRNPLFDVMFELQNAAIPELKIPGLTLTPIDTGQDESKFDMTWAVSESGDNLDFNIIYRTSLFEDERIQRFAGYFKELTASVLNQPAQPLKQANLLSQQERETILNEFNNTQAPFPSDKTISRLFEETVSRAPDRVAIVSNSHLTYKAFYHCVVRLAAELVNRGIGPDKITALLIEPSLEMAIGMMAILKAGGGFMPVSPELPEQRMNFMLADSQTTLLLTSRRLPPPSKTVDDVVYIEDYLGPESSDREVVPMLPPGHREAAPSDLIYIIYTSGTSGRPKGVMLEHGNLVNYATWFIRTISLNQNDRGPLNASFAFDPGYTLIFPSMITGGELHLLPVALYRSPEDFLLYIQRQGLTYIKMTPSLLSTLLTSAAMSAQVLRSLRFFMLGGEAIDAGDVETLSRYCPHTRIMNHYGPTETTIGTVTQFIDTATLAAYKRKPAIGRPLSNARAFIVDTHFNLLPIGVPGELIITGSGVARGYLNRPDLTIEKFIPNHKPSLQGPVNKNLFSKKGFGSRLESIYRTGDLTQWLPDGRILFMGRIDQQVKIRGNRIELKEIETALMSHEMVKEAVVTVHRALKAASGDFLCAYIVSSYPEVEDHIRSHLSQQLPDYMVPSYFVHLDAMPLTPNGKLDYRALPTPQINLESTYVSPKTQIQETLSRAWKDILAVPKIGIRDNFFHLGGDSIKAIRIASLLRSDGYTIDIKDLFQSPTIETLADKVKRTQRVIHQGTITGAVPLTPIQQWFFQGYTTDNHHYNQSIMLYAPKGFRQDVLQEAFSHLLHHHDALRMTFSGDADSGIHQYNRGTEKGDLFYIETLKLDSTDKLDSRIDSIATTIQQEMKLETGPLVRLGLFHTGAGDYLLIAIHHLVVDGVSWRILLEDLDRAYKQLSRGEDILLPSKTDSFKAYAEKLQIHAQRLFNTDSKETKDVRQYWNRIGRTVVQPVPVDNDISQQQDIQSNLAAIDIHLDSAQTAVLLKDVHQVYSTTIDDILLAALAMALKRWAGLEHVCLSMEGHGRDTASFIEDIDINRTIGWFTVRYPVIISGEFLAPGDTIKHVKETLRRIPDNGIGYGLLKENSEHAKSFELQPEISFNYLGQIESVSSSGSSSEDRIFELSAIPVGLSISPHLESRFKLSIDSVVNDGCFSFTFRTNRLRYKPETIQTLAGMYKESLMEIISHCTGTTEKEITPSDLGAAELSIDQLEDIKDMLEL